MLQSVIQPKYPKACPHQTSKPPTLLKPTAIGGKLEWFEPYLQPQKVIERCFPLRIFAPKVG
jgi:hypothetical protein